jgi:hypothetical protein
VVADLEFCPGIAPIQRTRKEDPGGVIRRVTVIIENDIDGAKFIDINSGKILGFTIIYGILVYPNSF